MSGVGVDRFGKKMSNNERLKDKIEGLTPSQRDLLEKVLRDEAKAERPETVIPRAREDGTAPLSFGQQRLWFLDALEQGNPFYNITRAYRLRGPLHTEALRLALQAVIWRHDALRTTFVLRGEEAVQRIFPPEDVHLPVEELGDSRTGAIALDVRIEEWLAAQARRSFDLREGPLLRAALLRVEEGDHLLLVSMHHIVSDGWSIGILMREWSALYDELTGGAPAALPELPIQYPDFARWQRGLLSGEVLARELSYWKKQLANLPPLDLPTDRPRPPVQTFRGARASFSLSPALTRALRTLSTRAGGTLYMTLVAAFGSLLARYTGQEDIVIGCPIAGRNRSETERLIGFFVNTLVLRLDLAGDPSFRDALKRFRDVALDAYAHQDLPFEKLVEELQPSRSLAQNALIQTTFALQNAPITSLRLAGAEVSTVGINTSATHFDLEVHASERAEDLAFTFVYATDLFDPSTIERMMGHYQRILEEVVRDPDRRISEIPVLDEVERGRLLFEWNQPGRTSGEPQRSLTDRFEEQAGRLPDAVALEFEGQTLSYGELNRRANRLAAHLAEMGAVPGVLVAVCLERSFEMVIALLGILKAGGVYVPLDPAYPKDRLRFMIQDAEARVLVSEARLEVTLPESPGVRLCLLDRDGEAIAKRPASNPELRVSPDSLAYVIYTSGSTGRPKGVLVTHGNVDRLFTATEPWFQFGPSDVWTLFHSYAFDFSVWEMWGALRYGGRLVVVPRAVARSPEAFQSLLANSGVTILNQTPSAFRGLIAQDAAVRTKLALRLIIFGGEALDPSILVDWFDLHQGESPRLVNMYGITETTVHVTYHPLTRADADDATSSVIGRPIPDLQVYALDRHMQPCPIGVAGELYVGGAGVARGYLNRPELTNQRFIANPFADDSSDRLYRSGDLGRFRANGDIQYLGRIDQQVKIRGHRIELGEIESVLGKHPGVGETVVVAREEALGDRRLIAYVTASDGYVPQISELRAFLKASLPEYMVPASFVFVDALPLTSNGKVDYRALPAPSDSALEKAFVAPRDQTELDMAQIWEEVLRRDRIGIEDDFFELGGHSLLATRLFARLRNKFSVDVPLRAIFETPTIAGLSQAVRAAAERGVASLSPRIARVTRQLETPAGEMQWVKKT